MTIFFTSDTHWGHSRVIQYSNRPFANIDEMDEQLIKNWNSKVQPNDTVYHLGDFAFHREDQIFKILSRLNGKIHLIVGNHDKQIIKNSQLQKQFQSISNYCELKIDNQFIVMCHYPMLSWNKSHHGSWMLHGHCHGSIQHPWNGKLLDVGTDPMKYFPISFDKLIPIMASKQFVNHHED